MICPPHGQSTAKDRTNMGWFPPVACPHVLQSCHDWGKEAVSTLVIKVEKKCLKGKKM